MTIAITGASGFVGSALCAAFGERGWHVRAGVRRPEAYKGPGEAFRYDLDGEVTAQDLGGASVVVHAAWEMRAHEGGGKSRVNLDGSRGLVDLATHLGARVIFVSSCSAHDRAVSQYGRGKLAVERMLEPDRDLVIRPGLVVGSGGLFARMVESVRRSPVIPLIDGGRQPVQTIALAEVCEGVCRAIETCRTGRLVMAHPEGITFGAMVGLIAQELGVRRFFYSISGAPFLWAARTSETLGFSLPLSSENLLGLRSMICHPSKRDLQSLGLELKNPTRVLRAGVKEIKGRYNS